RRSSFIQFRVFSAAIDFKIMRYLNSNLCTFSVTRLLKEATYQKEHCNESQGTNLSVVHCHSSSLHSLLPAPSGVLKLLPWLSSEGMDEWTDRRCEQGRVIYMV